MYCSVIQLLLWVRLFLLKWQNTLWCPPQATNATGDFLQITTLCLTSNMCEILPLTTFHRRFFFFKSGLSLSVVISAFFLHCCKVGAQISFLWVCLTKFSAELLGTQRQKLFICNPPPVNVNCHFTEPTSCHIEKKISHISSLQRRGLCRLYRLFFCTM